MKIQGDLMQLGIPTYMQTIYVKVPASAAPNFDIAKQMPTQIGWIYGISTYVDGFTPDNFPLITQANSKALYLQFTDGVSQFINVKRLSELNFDTTLNGYIYADMWECSIPGNIDLSQSKILNPTLITGAAGGTFVALNLYYVDWTSYQWLLDTKYIKTTRPAKNPNNK